MLTHLEKIHFCSDEIFLCFLSEIEMQVENIKNTISSKLEFSTSHYQFQENKFIVLTSKKQSNEVTLNDINELNNFLINKIEVTTAFEDSSLSVKKTEPVIINSSDFFILVKITRNEIKIISYNIREKN